MQETGWKRWTFAGLYVLQLLMIGLAQYTYAIVFAAAITAVELLGILFRKIFKTMPVGVSMLCAVLPLATLFLLRVPLVSGLQSLAAIWGFENIAGKFSASCWPR